MLGPFFSNKSIKQARKIILIEKNEIVVDDREVAEVFIKYFSTVTESTDIPKYDPIDKEYLSITDPVLRAIGKYKESILSLKTIWNLILNTFVHERSRKK